VSPTERKASAVMPNTEQTPEKVTATDKEASKAILSTVLVRSIANYLNDKTVRPFSKYSDLKCSFY